MADTGAPLPDPDHAVHALDCAMAMLDELAGLNSERAARGEGALRSELPVWLTTGPSASRVLAFRSAPARLGGSGAVLVLVTSAR